MRVIIGQIDSEVLSSCNSVGLQRHGARRDEFFPHDQGGEYSELSCQTCFAAMFV